MLDFLAKEKIEIEFWNREAGLSVEVRFDPPPENRGFVEQNYYAALSRLPALCRLVPSTADFIFRKPCGPK